MANAVCMGAMLKCSFGVAPSSLVVLPLNRVMSPQPVANIMDSKPFMNIMPFGMCQSLANPMVAAATARLEALVMLMAPEMDRHTARWRRPGSVEAWQKEVDVLRTFAAQRESNILKQLDAFEQVR